jgi:hypothetical protein
MPIERPDAHGEGELVFDGNDLHPSGASDVGRWLRQRGLEPGDDLVAAILAVAKATTHTLSEKDVMDVVHRVRE